MGATDDDTITRALVIHDRIARLRAHQTEERNRLYAIVIQELLADGYSLREAENALGLSKSVLHRLSQRDTTTCNTEEFGVIDEAVAQYVLDY